LVASRLPRPRERRICRDRSLPNSMRNAQSGIIQPLSAAASMAARFAPLLDRDIWGAVSPAKLRQCCAICRSNTRSSGDIARSDSRTYSSARCRQYSGDSMLSLHPGRFQRRKNYTIRNNRIKKRFRDSKKNGDPKCRIPVGGCRRRLRQPKLGAAVCGGRDRINPGSDGRAAWSPSPLRLRSRMAWTRPRHP
jgi:hypothetical protein